MDVLRSIFRELNLKEHAGVRKMQRETVKGILRKILQKWWVLAIFLVPSFVGLMSTLAFYLLILMHI